MAFLQAAMLTVLKLMITDLSVVKKFHDTDFVHLFTSHSDATAYLSFLFFNNPPSSFSLSSEDITFTLMKKMQALRIDFHTLPLSHLGSSPFLCLLEFMAFALLERAIFYTGDILLWALIPQGPYYRHSTSLPCIICFASLLAFLHSHTYKMHCAFSSLSTLCYYPVLLCFLLLKKYPSKMIISKE